MYEELVKRLRVEGEYADLVAYMHGIRPISPEDDAAKIASSWKELFAKAADAIEELNHKIESIESEREISPEAEYAIDKHADNLISHMDELIKGLKSKPRWIPVTERLPEKNQIVVAHAGNGTWDFGMFRGISSSGNQEYWHWKKNTLKRVKWWMPKDGALPDPPKQEETE